MDICVFSSQSYDETYLTAAAPHLDWQFISQPLDAVSIQCARGANAICLFVNDKLTAPLIDTLVEMGIGLVLLRCAGFNNVDVPYAKARGLRLARVPAYSPEAVAEHTVAMMLCLNRKLHKAYNRVRDDNFSLVGLLGFNLHGKNVGIIGTGRIGLATARILAGFGMQVLCYDIQPTPEQLPANARYVSLAELYQQADIVSLHCPLTPQTQHLINATSLAQMKAGVMLINTSRGGLIDTQAVIDALKSKHIGLLGLDVYEQEADLFFKDLSDQVIADEVFQRLLTFPNVLITGHQAFFTDEALSQIAHTTIGNYLALRDGLACPNLL